LKNRLKILQKNNKISATFLFSNATLKSFKITDIIDGDYDEIIRPEQCNSQFIITSIIALISKSCGKYDCNHFAMV